MESKNLTEALLSYYAIYDQDLREEMEDLGYFDEARDGYGGDEKFKQDTDRGSFRPGTDVPTVKKFGRIFKSTPHGIGAHANRTQSRVSTIVGNDPGAPRSEKMATKIKMVKGKDGTWKKVRVQAEELDAYDIVLMHLIDEGYASHPDAAEAIMSNMSEEWIEGIMEGQNPTPVTSRFEKSRRYGRGITPYTSQIASSEPSLGGGTYYKGKRTPKNPEKYRRQVATGVRTVSSQERERLGIKEDIYDIILSYLLDEGYASHPDAAEAIMSNMSEEWIEGIMEGYKPMTKKKNRKN